jgi:prepilin-type N-terminal cleavage/methylation domain-containing protein/prepilin-type processing-associated H-X9-DG protein
MAERSLKNNFNAAEGFTLLELLVVIAVIAVLAALLFPVVSAAKGRAQRTTCLNNLRQINLGVRMYSDDSNEAPPAAGTAAVSTNIVTLYSAYKEFMKGYVGLNGPASAQDKLFACPADSCYPSFLAGVTNGPYYYVRQSLHQQPILDFSSYAFNGGDNITRMVGPIAVTRPGLGGVKLGSIKHPGRTVLLTEASALVPWSWHEPSSRLYFVDAKNMVSFADGHVSYINIYWDSTPFPGGGVKFALAADPPAGYEYQWSPN